MKKKSPFLQLPKIFIGNRNFHDKIYKKHLTSARLYDSMECKAFIKNQLARSGTSIGANIHEAEYAESTSDFIHKLGIALKECNETEYWLIVLAEACPELAEKASQLRHDAGGIRRMLISTITTLKGRSDRN